MKAEASWADPRRARDPVPRTGVRLVVEGQLVRIGAQNFLFSPVRQAVFSLNDTAADIWRCLAEGVPPEAISSRMAGRGVDADVARGYVESALGSWERLGLIRPRAPRPISSRGRESRTLAIAGMTIRIEYPCRSPAAQAFRHLEVRGRDAGVLLRVVEHGDRIHLFRNGVWTQSCPPDELPVQLKGQLLTEVLEQAAYELAVHAAALVRHDRVLLLCGRPGAGKTTLALALVHAGFGFAGDDVTLLDARGLSVPLPFAPAVKAGVWRLLARFCDGLELAPVFRRPDGKRVRYPVPKAVAPPIPRRVGWIVLLHRDAKATTCLEPIEPAEALQGLLDGAFARDGGLTATGFDVLAQVIGGARIWRLRYSSLDDAVALLGKACR